MPKAISAHGNTPVLTLCRKLVEAGIDPTRCFSVRGRLAE